MFKKSNQTESVNYSYIKNYSYLFREMHQHSKWNMLLYFGFFFASLLATYSTIYFSKLILQLVLAEVSAASIILACSGFGSLLAFLSIIRSQTWRQLKTQCLKMRHYFQKKILRKLNAAAYSNLENPDYRRSVDLAKELYDRWDRDVCECVFNSLDFLITCAQFAISSVMLFQVHPLVIMALVVSSLLQYYTTKYHVEWNRTHKHLWQPVRMKIQYLLDRSSDFSYAKDYRLYRADKWLNVKYGHLMKEWQMWVSKDARIDTLTRSGSILFQYAGLAVVYLFLLRRVTMGEITGDMFVLYIGLATNLNSSLSSLSIYFPLLRTNMISIAEYRQMLEMEDSSNRKAGEGRPILKEGKRRIDFSHVSFQYPDFEEATLKDIHFTVKEGEKLAIVGLNGAGKTTLIKLLCGMYEPTEGEILIDGINNQEWDLESYYDLFTVVFQDFNVIPATVAENVACVSSEKLDRKEVERCLRKADLWKRVSELPKGMDTYLQKEMFQDGVNLSGGETQKVLLARAIYKQAPILILDEPTAALDAIAEQNLYLRYNELTENRTSIFISHRLASTRFCDRIMMMRNGKIVENGTHEELMEKQGEYYQLFQLQSHYYKESRREDFDSSMVGVWEVSSYVGE